MDELRESQNQGMKFNYIGTSQKALVAGSIAATTTPDFIDASNKAKKNRKKK